MLLRQTIHHGRYFNVLELDTVDHIDSALTQLGQTSPYRFNYDPARNRAHAKLRADLLAEGAGCFGWSEIKVITCPPA